MGEMLKKDRVQGCVAAGVALVGAGVMAVSAVAPQAPNVLKAQNAQVELAAVISGPPAELFALSGVRAAQAFVGAPLGFAAAAAALAEGDDVKAYQALEAVIDGPLWAADPAIYALDDLFPAPIGGQPVNEQTGPNTSAITQFRANVLIAARDALRDFANQAVGTTGATGATTLAATQPTYTDGPAELLLLSAQRGVQTFLGAPLGIAAAAVALSEGRNGDAYDILEDVVDGPLWAADPAIYAFDDLFPAPIGGDPNTPTEPGTGAITQFRAQVLIAARDALRGVARELTGTTAPTGRLALVAAENPAEDFDALGAATQLAEGFGQTAVRGATSAVAAPLGLVAVVDGLRKSFSGDGNSALYLALREYVDGPNYVIDPIVFSVDDVLPAPVGGDPEVDPRLMTNSEVTRFRANVLLAPRDQVREALAGALDVDPVTGTDIPAVQAGSVETGTPGATDRVAASATAIGDDSTVAPTKQPKRPLTQLRESFDASRAKPSDAADSTSGRHRAPTTGSRLQDGLRDLFKKPAKKAGQSEQSEQAKADPGAGSQPE